MGKMPILKIRILYQLRHNDGNLRTGQIVIILPNQFLYYDVLVLAEDYIVEFEVIDAFVDLFVEDLD